MTVVSNVAMSDQEKQAYVDYITEKNGRKPC